MQKIMLLMWGDEPCVPMFEQFSERKQLCGMGHSDIVRFQNFVQALICLLGRSLREQGKPKQLLGEEIRFQFLRLHILPNILPLCPQAEVPCSNFWQEESCQESRL